ncbi:hypothetical protein [Streptococcus sp. DD12]|uniref:hypothetical protein n=1 Tax=Streptococcus sp. DD12 TaxID=1777880 RepID=UPI00079A9992|nr:hypothetical protein [Streptococcus sp. DD12]KXT75378.1 prophage Lp1 protein 6 [Streptococcus sp. DD12]
MFPQENFQNKDSKSLATACAIVGLAGGIYLLFGFWFLMLAAATGSDFLTSIVLVFGYLVRLAVLVLGIVGAVTFKGALSPVKSAPSVLLIVGGAISFIPLLGWIGGIVAIIGGALYLASLKNFNQTPQAPQNPQNPFMR